MVSKNTFKKDYEIIFIITVFEHSPCLDLTPLFKNTLLSIIEIKYW